MKWWLTARTRDDIKSLLRNFINSAFCICVPKMSNTAAHPRSVNELLKLLHKSKICFHIFELFTLILLFDASTWDGITKLHIRRFPDYQVCVTGLDGNHLYLVYIPRS